MLSDRCLSLSVLPVTFVYCGQMVGWIKMKLGTKVGLGPGHTVLDGDQFPLPQRGTVLPQFSAHICCGQTAGRIKMPLGREVGLGPSNILLDGTQLPSQKGGTTLLFSAHVCCCQTAGRIKMPLGTKVGLCPGHIVLHGDPAPHTPKGVQPPPPIFGPCLLWPNGRPS